MSKLKVGLLGATGLVGQAYLAHLTHHPYFEVCFLAGSSQSAGRSYTEALSQKGFPLVESLKPYANEPVYDALDIQKALKRCQVIFSACPTHAAQALEPLYAQAGFPVISNASAFRMQEDIPLLIPELNSEHLDLIESQKKKRGWPGYIVTKSNCSLMSYLIPLFPLHQKFGLKKVIVSTLQSISGAGYPGLASLDMLNNVIPHIQGEETKSEKEPLKILGTVKEGELHPLTQLDLSVSCNRVPILEGHLACVHVSFDQKPTREEILQSWNTFQPLPQQLKLPSAPSLPIHYLEEPNRPQPKYDLFGEQSMAISVGQLRPCSVLDYKFVGLSHNLHRGASQGGLLIAELLYQQGKLSFHPQSNLSKVTL